MNNRIGLRKQYREGLLDKHQYSQAMAEQHKALAEYIDLLHGSDIEAIEIDSEGVWLRSRLAHVTIACDPGDRGTPAMVSLNFGQYERMEFDMWRRLIPKGAVIADVGANIGWYSAHAAALDSSAHIVAFEPVPGSFACLVKTIARNSLTNIIPQRLAVSDHPRQIVLQVDSTIGGAASEHPTTYADTSSPVCVDATTLDEYFSGRARVDAIKLDVEGGELAVLRGARHILSEHRPIILCEMLRRHARAFGYHPNDVMDLMRTYGYACYTTNSEGLRPFARMEEDTIETNFFFLHAQTHLYLIKDQSA